MNDIITDFIGKQVSKRLAQNQPISTEKQVFTDKQINHWAKCRKLDCLICEEINMEKGD